MKYPVFIAVGIYVAFLLVMGLVPDGQSASVAGFILFCVATGVIEEGVFCGGIFNLLLTKTLYWQAALVTALLFGVAHLSLAEGIGLGLLKAVQAGAFSLCMIGLYQRTKKLWVPMTAHAAFDLFYFAAPYAATEMLPPYPPAHALDANLVILIVTTLFFAICAIIIVKFPTDHMK